MAIMRDFLEKREYSVVIVVLTAAGQLEPSLHLPVICKNKAVYFLKRSVKRCV